MLQRFSWKFKSKKQANTHKDPFSSNSLIWFPLKRHELFDKSDKSMSIISNPSFKAVGYQWVCLSVCLFVSYLFYAKKKTLKIPPMTSRLNNSI